MLRPIFLLYLFLSLMPYLSARSIHLLSNNQNEGLDRSFKEKESFSIFQVDLSPFHGEVQSFYKRLQDLDIDLFASHPTSATFLTHPDSLKDLLSRFPFPLSYKVVVANVSDYLHQEKLRQQSWTSPILTTFPFDQPMDWFKQYHPLENIETFYNELEKKFPNRVRILPNIGFSHEGRAIMAVSITEGQKATISQASHGVRPQFYIQGGIHAREWISHATLQYITFHLASSSDPAIVSLLNAAEFLIVPVLNPDGYVYTWERDRLWRKNRRQNSDRSHGVDLNRNFDARWGHEGTSRVPSSETYCGPSAGSEPEVKAVTQFFEAQEGIVMALDLHSYSQLILRPIGWTHKDAPHEKQLKKVGKNMVKIIQGVHDKIYISEKSVALYPTTGAAHDWFYMQKKTLMVNNEPLRVRPYAMTIELRPTAEWFGPGFLLDASEIIPTGQEILPAVLHLANYSLAHPLLTKKSIPHMQSMSILFLFPYLYFLIPILCFVLWTRLTLRRRKGNEEAPEKQQFFIKNEKETKKKENRTVV